MLQLVHTKRGRWSPAGILDSTGEPQLLQKFKIYTLKKSGARRGNRTHTVSPPPDFESGASTSSAIRACQAGQYMRLTLLVESQKSVLRRDFHFALPKDLIPQRRRGGPSASRLLTLDRLT